MRNINLFGSLESADKKNEFDAVRLTLASPEKIRAWSFGEVRAPETINYRTFRPEVGGLFCAKIFGPTKDYECLCGKYKRMKYRGVVCEKCGVEVTLAKVRRERMGHVNLACPVAHILFFKALPSRIGLVLDLTMRDIERILYFEVHVVIDVDWQRMQDKVERLTQALTSAVANSKFVKERAGALQKVALAPMFEKWKKEGRSLDCESAEKEIAGLPKLESGLDFILATLRRDMERERANSDDEAFAKTKRMERAASDADEFWRTLSRERRWLPDLARGPKHLRKMLLQEMDRAGAEGDAEYENIKGHIGELEKLFTLLWRGNLLTVDQYQELKENYPNVFTAGIGAEGVRDFLKSVNLDDEAMKVRLGARFNLSRRDIELIFKFSGCLVHSPGRGDRRRFAPLPLLKEWQVLGEEEEKDYRQQEEAFLESASDEAKAEFEPFEIVHGDHAAVGDSDSESAPAAHLGDFLGRRSLSDDLEMLSDTRRGKIFKRLKILDGFRSAKLRPEWMVLETLPVMPPDLRPLVQLEGGRFTTSDINDLYRRVINRNNRLKRLMELDAPEVIINNEKRMLQESVDSLLDNGRRGKPAAGANRRPLKSVVDSIKGKSGRFRQNLLGKRVDFSGRSVIVVGPDLQLHQCGLPKQMALTLFRPFVFNKLVERGDAGSVKDARLKVDSEDPAVWGALEEVIAQHPVLLNRAPTLHRLGVQAFEPVLIEGKSIQLHPLVCVAFNADFDGDQMAVHVPLALESQAEARVLMLSSNNILHPANGEPIIVPTQDVVLGLYYATRERADAPGAGMRFGGVDEVERALAAGVVSLQTPIQVLLPADMEEKTRDEYEGVLPPPQLVSTTAGRALMKNFLPPEILFSEVNKTMKKRDIVQLIRRIFQRAGQRATVEFCDRLMRFGFEQSTRAGISVCMNDMVVPDEKRAIIAETEARVQKTRQQFQNGLLTEDERYNTAVDLWDKAGERVTRAMMDSISSEEIADSKGKKVRRDSFNSIYMMADSGARGSETQIKQLAGMRGLMARPDGRIMENAITANFREGLSVLQYFVSTHGARKGLTDTALKTANSGYLTRRLVDVTQDIVVARHDCSVDVISLEECDAKTAAARVAARPLDEAVAHPESGEVICKTGAKIGEEEVGLMMEAGVREIQVRNPVNGIAMRALLKDGDEIVSLSDRIVGRFLAEKVLHPQTQKVIYKAGTYITEKEAEMIAEADVGEVKVRSPVTCEAGHGLCVKCYGRDLGRGRLAQLGEAVGVVAAQSIGEPGTQLTMRTFHIGGAAAREATAESINARNSGVLRLSDARCIKNREGNMVVVSRGGKMSVQEKGGRERESYRLQYGQVIKFAEGDSIRAGDNLSQRDAMTRPFVSEYAGDAKLENIEMGVNARRQIDEETGLPVIIIGENKHGGKKLRQPQMKLLNKKGEEVRMPGIDRSATIVFPPGAILSVQDGGKVAVGDVVAKLPMQTTKSRDITGGLPRVAQLFEARDPEEPSILACATGRVELRGAQRGKQILAIVDKKKDKEHYEIIVSPKRKLFPRNGEEVLKGQVIADAGEGQKRICVGDGCGLERGLVLIKNRDPAEERQYVREQRAAALKLCSPDSQPPRLRKWAERHTAALADFSEAVEHPRVGLLTIVAAARKEIHRIAEGSGALKTKVNGWHVRFENRCQPSKFKTLSQPLATWATETAANLRADKKGRSYDKLRAAVELAEVSLTALVSGGEGLAKTPWDDFRRRALELTEAKDMPLYLKPWADEWRGQFEKFADRSDYEGMRKLVADSDRDLKRRMDGSTSLKTRVNGWYLRFINLCKPEKVSGLSAAAVRWGAETLAELEPPKPDDRKRATRVRSPRLLQKIINTAEESLASIAASAPESSPAAKLLKNWRKRKDEIAGEYRELIEKGAAPDDAAAARADQLRERAQGLAAALKQFIADKGAEWRLLSDWRRQVQKIADEYQAIPPEDRGADENAFALEKSLRAIADDLRKAVRIVEIFTNYHHVPKGRTILVQDGDTVNDGEEIVGGESNSHEILARRGVDALVEHIVNEVQDVYRLQGVSINDKHIEVIIHQMLRCVSVTSGGDSYFIPGDQVMKSELNEVNMRLAAEGKRPAEWRQILLGITKASLATDSFISAASFQETSRVLTEAAVAGRRDSLRGLKENVIVGRLVPAGTGFVHHQTVKERNAQMDAEHMLREGLETATTGEGEGEQPPAEPPAAEDGGQKSAA